MARRVGLTKKAYATNTQCQAYFTKGTYQVESCFCVLSKSKSWTCRFARCTKHSKVLEVNKLGTYVKILKFSRGYPTTFANGVIAERLVAQLSV